MSKFQVGDYVRHVNSDAFDGRWHGPVEAIGGTTDGCQRRLWLGGGENVAADLFELVAKAGEWVPDVDGNPIRPGQLVEDLDGALGWVERVDGDRVGDLDVEPYPLVLLNGRWTASVGCRVVDSTFRPPEPDTRDVQLLVTVNRGGDWSDEAVRDEVENAIVNWFGTEARTVEVVDTTDTGEGDA